jgi:hypothetical protein
MGLRRNSIQQIVCVFIVNKHGVERISMLYPGLATGSIIFECRPADQIVTREIAEPPNLALITSKSIVEFDPNRINCQPTPSPNRKPVPAIIFRNDGNARIVSDRYRVPIGIIGIVENQPGMNRGAKIINRFHAIDIVVCHREGAIGVDGG